MTDERTFLAKLRRIASHPAARGLADDAAVLGDLVLTHDSLAEGIHFRPDDPPASIGWKLVAVNLSDLAAKGATPLGVLMSYTLRGDEQWEDRFLSGVAAACEAYDCPLLGGDTIALGADSPRVLGLTALGRAAVAPARGGGEPGDALWVIGTIGDAAAGLALLDLDPDAHGALVEAYRRPVPLLAAGQALAGTAHAMMDVSDGLLIDAVRLAAASGVGVTIDLAALPLSPAFVAERSADRGARLFAATGGDDYALLVALAPECDPALNLSLPAGSIMARVGSLHPGAGLTLVDGAAVVPVPERLGYEHRPA